jgi:hypothetical protein
MVRCLDSGILSLIIDADGWRLVTYSKGLVFGDLRPSLKFCAFCGVDFSAIWPTHANNRPRDFYLDRDGKEMKSC